MNGLSSWQRLRAHWFLPLAALIALTDAWVVRTGLHHQSERLLRRPEWAEWALLADLALIIPLLYLLCYRHQGRRAGVRALALIGLGVWLAAKILPADEQALLAWLAPLRYLGAAALVVLEAKVLLAVARAAWGGTDQQALARQLNRDASMPPWVAQMAAWEAALWARLLRWVSRFLRR